VGVVYVLEDRVAVLQDVVIPDVVEEQQEFVGAGVDVLVAAR